MDGTGGDLMIHGICVGALGAWHLRTLEGQGGALTFTASGRFAAYWVSAGARRATARAVFQPRQARGVERRPVSPAPPTIVSFTGDVQRLTINDVVLINVVLERAT